MRVQDLRVVVTAEQKREAKEILASKNMNVSAYLRLAVENLIKTKEIPFDVKTPNKTTMDAIKRGQKRAQQLDKKYMEIHSND